MIEKARNENAEEHLKRALKMFKCNKDADIQDFLHNKAIDFVKRGICSVFLLLDEECFENHQISILAYYTLSHKSIIFNSNTSKSKIQHLARFKNRNNVSVVLIGQLGKYIDSNSSSSLSIENILDFAFETIKASNELIPCRAALVECSQIIHDLQIYEKANFKYLQQDGEFHQYYKIIN